MVKLGRLVELSGANCSDCTQVKMSTAQKLTENCIVVDHLINQELSYQVTPERMKARQLAKAKAFEAEMKKQTTAMSSLVIGCIWWNPHTSGSATDPSYNKLAQFAVCTHTCSMLYM